MPDVRAQVLGAPRRTDTGQFLVQRLHDDGTEFHRFIGGGIHPGEHSTDAVEREFREELDVAVEAGRALCTVENLFTYDGAPRHELVVVRDVELENQDLYERDRFHGVDAGGDLEYEAYWRSLEALRAAGEPFYPEGIGQLLAKGDGEGAGHMLSPQAVSE